MKPVKAKWWEMRADGKILCTLCPRYCTMGEGQHGFCYIRKNTGSELWSIGYGRPTGFAMDPVEKKPLNHFLPGTGILSFGTAGCNLGCKFCQNWTISKAKLDDSNSVNAAPEDVVALALKHKAPSIAITYNDPVIIGEYVIDIAEIAKLYDVKVVLVTAGYIDKNARPEVFKNISAANVDLKAFTPEFYKNFTYSELDAVLDTLLWLRNESDIWFEITTLLIPGENDSADEIKRMSEWIVKNLGDEVPLHFTAFHPDFKMTGYPYTPPETLKAARSTAMAGGIKYCYTGNIYDINGQTTYCPGCGTPVIRRNRYDVEITNLTGNKCTKCGYKIAGIFN